MSEFSDFYGQAWQTLWNEAERASRVMDEASSALYHLVAAYFAKQPAPLPPAAPVSLAPALDGRAALDVGEGVSGCSRSIVGDDTELVVLQQLYSNVEFYI